VKPNSTSTPRFLSGVPDSAAGAAVAALMAESKSRVLVLLSHNLGRAEAVAEDARFYAGLRGLPDPELRALPPAAEDGAGAFESECDMLAAISALRAASPQTRDGRRETGGRAPGSTASSPISSPPSPVSFLLLAASPEALIRPCPGKETVGRTEILLRPGSRANLRELVERLAKDFDYDHEALCESPGQFAVRGGIVDVYPLNEHAPVRIDFFGDEIESLRVFDPVSQRSEGEPLPVLVIAAPVGGSGEARPGAFFEHLPDDALFVWVEPSDEAPTGWPKPPDSLRRAMLSPLEESPEWFDCPTSTDWSAESLEFYSAEPDAAVFGLERLESAERLRAGLLRRLAGWRAEGRRVLLVCETSGGVERLKEIVAEQKEDWLTEPTPQAVKSDGSPEKKKPTKRAAKKNADAPAVPPVADHPSPVTLSTFDPEYFTGRISEGFALPAGRAAAALGAPKGFVVCTERELFGRHRKRPGSLRARRLPHKSRLEQILDFHELAEGDLLVHLKHGVCRYRGITKLELRGAQEEVVSLEFADNVTMYTPLREAHLLSKYVGLTKISPRLGKIGSDGWQKTRKAAETATVDIAADLLAMQAKRHSVPGHAFPPDAGLPWMGEFERAFPFRETPDQSKAIVDTKADMERPSPMDRLVCGDVGYGKTEVAIRAAFKAVLGGRQVALLCPTTILAQQHYNTFRERFANFPVTVELLSRFRKPAQRAKVAAAFNAGQIDIVVGTHALLSASIKPPNLGLAIIDEEHRFGVRHKEAFKRLRENVDVLAMSATPIPRTLYMALMGARDLSVIETPPKERLPIRTVVKAYDEKLVEQAIRYEVGRGGQVFYLHNRVDTIEAVASRLRDMLPEMRIGVGHGQMDEEDLEDMMTRFVAAEFDVLVCTTIIETGLDIPNCNTLIIEGADRFGLSQLYQLRGRVGRFNRQAYAYLLLHKHASMLDPARKRLGAIRQFNQLGAGFRIAMRDLELRGAGNLLGREQSGYIAGVGFELYCQLLRQSVSRLKGEKESAAVRAEVRLDFIKFSQLPDSGAQDPGPGLGYETLRAEELEGTHCADIVATIPSEYISEVRLRVDAFRRLAMAATVDEVCEIAAGLEDRFGKPPREAKAFLAVSEIRCLAESRGIIAVETEASRLKCKLARPRADGSQYLKVGANFPRLERTDPYKRLEEIRSYLLRQPKV
jgi:transcription-repair coupling factor (superfamily II helicase)